MLGGQDKPVGTVEVASRTVRDSTAQVQARSPEDRWRVVSGRCSVMKIVVDEEEWERARDNERESRGRTSGIALRHTCRVGLTSNWPLIGH